MIDKWIVTAGDLFESVIVRNEIPINDMPPALQVALNESKDEEVKSRIRSMKDTVLQAAFREMESTLDLYNIPDIHDLGHATKANQLQWDPIASFSRSPSQSEESFQEQEMALNNVTLTIDNYLDALRQNTFVKCRVITGAPGSGKSFLLNYACIYAISKGLSVGITALMSQRAVHLGGSIFTSCSTSL